MKTVALLLASVLLFSCKKEQRAVPAKKRTAYAYIVNVTSNGDSIKSNIVKVK